MTRTIIHVPHAGMKIPLYHSQRFVRPKDEIRKLSAEIADSYVDSLFDTGRDMLVFPVSRLAVDVERFTDPAQEIMAPRGLGVIYTNYYDGKPLRKEIPDCLKVLEMMLYRRHHNRLAKMVNDRLDNFGTCLIIDAHSFCPEPFSLDIDQETPRPDICIGTDEIHTSDELKQYMADRFVSLGYRVKENSPYSGTIVPLKKYGDNRVSSVMIEVNKSLYMDGLKIDKDKFQKLNRELKEIINNI